jgi:hypothetical protein
MNNTTQKIWLINKTISQKIKEIINLIIIKNIPIYIPMKVTNSYKPINLQKNEEKISIDYSITQSNSSSHEETNNNNQYNSNDNNTNITALNDNFNSNDSQTLNIEEENKIIENNNNYNVTDLQNLNLNSNLSPIENIKINSNLEIINNNNIIIPNDSVSFQIPIPSIPPIKLTPQIQVKKNKKQKKIKNFVYLQKN